MRKKWLEPVEYIASETRDMDTEPNKIIMRNAPNGDLYLTICPVSHRGGITMRFERSGGCSVRNPRLLHSLTECYDALADNEDNSSDTKLSVVLNSIEKFVIGKENSDLVSMQEAFNEFKDILIAGI